MKILELLTPRKRIGNLGENLACRYLKKNGYRIIERNYVMENHEIDIIAEDRDTVVFVEVKARTIDNISPKEPRPACAVNKKKQQSIITAARIYLAMKRPKKKVRFDVIEVYLINKNGKKSLAELKHLKNTFNANTAYG